MTFVQQEDNDNDKKRNTNTGGILMTLLAFDADGKDMLPGTAVKSYNPCVQKEIKGGDE